MIFLIQVRLENMIKKTDNAEKLFFTTSRVGEDYPAQLIYGKKAHGDTCIVFPWDKLKFEMTKR